ncbi:MAG: PIG-L family deacetylase, partial [Chitinophagaceae bacterium]
MKSRLFTLLGVLFVFPAFSQTPPSFSSSDIFLQLQKLRVLGSVLYVAAHPDDENTRLLAWLAKDRMYRTGYLSITRGDGGQNLIGDEQGVDLGLIRTQELLAARRIDGAEQFFTRGFDFGYTKTTQEALATWNQEKVLADVVWVIRKFRPDVLIARFPEDNRAGHGHHSASAVLAHEAFRAAADSTRFSEQLTQGVTTWQCKRILWNTFNFGGGSNTTSEDQLKVDVGSYNNLLGKSFGEIAATSRSQHKSQGFGVPASRGSQWEYFSAIEGSLARKALMEGVETSWQRIPGTVTIAKLIDSLITGFVISRPEASVPMLVRLYQNLQQLPEAYWKEQKVKEVKELIEACGGLWMEAACNAEYAVQGDTLSLQVTVNDRAGITSRLVKVGLQNDPDAKAGQVLEKNKNLSFVLNKYIDPRLFPLTQPYWLVEKMAPGSYNVPAQTMRGLAQDPPPLQADFQLEIAGVNFTFSKPVRYKYTDPVKGELYQPLVIAPPVVVSTEPAILLFRKGQQQTLPVKVKLTAYHNFSGLPLQLTLRSGTTLQVRLDSSFSLAKGLSKEYAFTVRPGDSKGLAEDQVRAYASLPGRSDTVSAYLNVTGIQYDHIPPIHYYYEDVVKVLNIDLKTAGKRIGYIEGAGDRVPQA